MEVVAATFGVHQNQDKFIPSQGARPNPAGPLSCAPSR